MAYRIGTYLLEPEAYEIRREGVLVPVEPQVFDLLVLLIANRQRALSKDEIIERVWEGRVVSDATLSSRIRTARQVLGDDGSVQGLIRTIHGRGFRFVGDVEEVDLAAASSGDRRETGVTKRDEDRAPAGILSTAGAGLGVRSALAVLPPHWRQWAAAAAGVSTVVCAALAGLYLFTPSTDSSEASTVKAHGVPLAAASLPSRPEFRDCDVCPEMVVLPEGVLLMGGAPADPKRRNVELPQHLVRIPKQFAIGKFEVTFDQFAAFVDATGHQPATQCNVFALDLDRWVGKSTTFRDPHYPQDGSHPVTCVNWLDAKAFTAWLSEKTGKPYRLPTEAEWEYAARAATTTLLSFGDYKRVCDYAKFADASTRFAWKDQSCSGNLGHGAAPVGRHLPNPWGLYDMHGNVWEWVEDCWHASYDGAPEDGTPWLEDNNGDCARRITRGGSWRNAVQDLRVTARLRYPTTHAAQVRGFRVALSLDSR